MYAYLHGKIVESSPNEVVVDVGGVGFSVIISLSTFANLPPLGKEATLHTAFIVREDFQGLYGFLLKEEKELFHKLLSVNGVGPKIALALIGHLSISDMEEAILNQDVKRLSEVPGIGKKIAERILLEMKDRVKGFSPGTKSISSGCELESALLSLGYSPADARKLAAKAKELENDKASLSTLIKRALQLGSKEHAPISSK